MVFPGFANGSRFINAAGGGGGPALILDGLNPTGAWSMSRDLLSSFVGGSFYTDAGGGAISSLNDQSGNARHLAQGTSGNRPAATTAGPNSVACADFLTDDRLVGAAISNFIANNSGYIVVSFLPDTITTNSATIYANHGVFSDGAAQIIAMTLRANTTPRTIYAYNWDGSVDAASSAAITAGTAYVAEWKHEGGNVSLRVNGGSWIDQASGNTTSLTGLLTMGTVSGGAGASLDGKIFEMAAFSTIPSSGDRDAIVADFKTHIGI